MSSTVQVALEPSSLVSIVYWTVFVSALALEIYTGSLFIQWVSNFLWPLMKRWAEESLAVPKMVTIVVQDFRCGRFYKPWGRKEPVIIRNSELVRELSEAPALSQRAVYADVLGLTHTLNHTRAHFDPNLQRSARYRLAARVIHVIGMSQIADLQPFLQAKLEKTSIEEIDSQSTVDGWAPVKLAPFMRKSTSAMLGMYMFGEKMTQDPEFVSALVRFSKDVVICMGVLQLVPKIMSTFVYGVITNRGRALNVLFTRLKAAIDHGWDEEESLKKMTLFYNMIESSKDSHYWTDDMLIQSIVGMWIAASHLPSVTTHFVFLELCTRPEYVQQLRDEIGSESSLDYIRISKLPILDSFIKEAIRVNNPDRLTIRRKALQPYTFSKGGPHVSVGDIACVSAWDIMHNEKKYPGADQFDGHRFINKSPAISNHLRSHDDSMRGTTLSDASQDFPIWGYGSKVCPGRGHASLVMKLVVIHLVMKYDFRLQDENASHKWFWETIQMPYDSTKVLFRKRSSK